MKVRLLENTIWGPAGAVIRRSDSAFTNWVKHNAALVHVFEKKVPPPKVELRVEYKPKVEDKPKIEPKAETPKDYKGVKNA